MKFKSKDREKICNMCGECTLDYITKDNAPLCSDCMPVKEIRKISSESDMLNKILKKKE